MSQKQANSDTGWLMLVVGKGKVKLSHILQVISSVFKDFYGKYHFVQVEYFK